MGCDNNVFFSIITINYNNAKGLEKTLSSVAAQTFDDWEQVIIDGGSTDGSVDVIECFLNDEAYARHVSFWCSEKDKGIYNAMNKGTRKASGKWCLFLNSGDALHDKNVLKDCHAEIVKTNADVVYGDMYKIYSDKKELRQVSATVDIRFFFKESIRHQASFIRRELLLKDPYDERLKIASDWKFFLVCFMKGGKFTHIPRIISDFDMSGISHRHTELPQKERELVIDELLPPELITYLETEYQEPMHTWGRLGRQYAQVPVLWKVCIFFNKAVLKILRVFKIVAWAD